MEAIRVKNLVVAYKDVTAVNDISFEIQRGEIFGIIGPNGAGKTSALECIEGLRAAKSGAISVLDIAQGNWRAIHKKIGIQLQETKMQDNLKVVEICKLFQSFYEKPVAFEGLLEMFDLQDSADKLIKKLSGGQRQKLAIILALIGDPDILFLDEISNGLDPYARMQIWNKIKGLRDAGKTIIMTTHFMEEAENLCDRVCMMVGGKIKAMGTLYDLILQADLPIQLTIAVPEGKAKDIALPVQRAQISGNAITLHVKTPGEISPAIGAIASQSDILDIDILKPSMEDVFFKLTGAKLEVKA